jgi:hypothetical protein
MPCSPKVTKSPGILARFVEQEVKEPQAEAELAKAEMTGTIGRILPTLDHFEEILLGKLTREEGIGWYSPAQKLHQFLSSGLPRSGMVLSS